MNKKLIEKGETECGVEKNNANKGRAKREKKLDGEEKIWRDMMGRKQGDECVPSNPAPGNPIRQQK